MASNDQAETRDLHPRAARELEFEHRSSVSGLEQHRTLFWQGIWAGLTPTELIDYYAVKILGYKIEDWAAVRDVSEMTLEKHIRTAIEKADRVELVRDDG